MVEESSKKKATNSKFGKSFKDVNRDLRAKLANINKNLLSIGSKEKKSQSMRLPPAPPAPIKTTAKDAMVGTAHAPQRTPVLVRKKESATRSQGHRQKATSNEIATATTSPSRTLPVVKWTVFEKKAEEDMQELSTLSSSSSNSKIKKVPTKKLDASKQAMPKFYTEKQLKKMIDKLYKQTKALRAEDPAVEKLLKETRESIRAIEALEKLYHHVHEEAKARTKRLMDDFEHLKNMRLQHGRDLDTQIAQQVRTEVDSRKELEDMLNDSNVKNLMAKPMGRKEEVEQQPPFITSVLRSILGL
ncbi:hypothetical protein Aduo_003754 [Ancylostoma duodenale]